jgi:glycosyltransferase involved in cell wall biosynthesis
VVHDISFDYFSEFFSIKRRIWHFLLNPRWLCRRSSTIIAVSSSTKEDLINYYGISAKKIKIGFPKIDLESYQKAKEAHIEEKKQVREKHQLPTNYILFLGTIEPRKNIIAAVKAFEYLKQKKGTESWARELKLVIAGGKGWLWEGIIGRIKDSPWKSDIILTGFVGTKDKPWLYALAQVFLFPSFFEGFGIPPLEAMAAGTPVVTANNSSLPEVVKDAAFLIDAYRPYEISLALEELLKDNCLRKKMIKKGEQRVREIAQIDYYSTIAL